MNSAQKKALKAYVDFHGDPPTDIIEYNYPDTETYGHRLGRATAIAYETVRDGTLEQYIHEFGDKKGPFIDVSTDGHVYLNEGEFSVTDRGFEDHKSMPAFLTVNPHGRGERRKKKANPMAAARNSKGQFVKKRKAARRKSNPVKALSRRPQVVFEDKRTIRKRRRNPIGGRRRGKISIARIGMTAVTQGIGAVVVSVAAGVLPLPENLKTGPVGTLVKVGLSVGLGMAVGKMVNAKFGEDIAIGGSTVAVAQMIAKMMPSNVPMGAMTYNPDIVPNGQMMNAIYDADMGELILEDGTRYVDNGMGDWVPMSDMGYVSPANIVEDVPRTAYG